MSASVSWPLIWNWLIWNWTPDSFPAGCNSEPCNSEPLTAFGVTLESAMSSLRACTKSGPAAQMSAPESGRTLSFSMAGSHFHSNRRGWCDGSSVCVG